MSVSFEDVKAVLDYCIGENPNWRRIAIKHNNSGSVAPDPNLFGWETEEQLLSAKARGRWLINPEFKGNGKGHKTNLVRILTQPEGLFGYPRMPQIGNKIDRDSNECRTIVEWIDNLPCNEDLWMNTSNLACTGADAKFLALGDELPPVPKLPDGFNFVQAKQVGPILHISGMGPQWGKSFKEEYLGKVWQDLSMEQAYAAARLTGLNLLHVVREHVGSLDQVHEVLELFAMVNASPNFKKGPLVVNGCSDLLVEILGEHGKHVRTAASAETPFDIAVYIKMSVRVGSVS